jgi:hypothetical protein
MSRQDRRRRRLGGWVGRLREKREAARRFGYRGDPRGEVRPTAGPGREGGGGGDRAGTLPKWTFFSRAPSAPRELDGRDKKRKTLAFSLHAAWEQYLFASEAEMRALATAAATAVAAPTPARLLLHLSARRAAAPRFGESSSIPPHLNPVWFRLRFGCSYRRRAVPFRPLQIQCPCGHAQSGGSRPAGRVRACHGWFCPCSPSLHPPRPRSYAICYSRRRQNKAKKKLLISLVVSNFRVVTSIPALHAW